MRAGQLATFDNVELWWIADCAPKRPTLVASNLVLPSAEGLLTGGSYAAFAGRIGTSYQHPATDCALIVVEVETGHVWKLGQPSSTTYWADPSIVTARELVVAECEHDPYDAYSYGAKRLVSLDITALDALEATFPSAPQPTPDAGQP